MKQTFFPGLLDLFRHVPVLPVTLTEAGRGSEPRRTRRTLYNHGGFEAMPSALMGAFQLTEGGSHRPSPRRLVYWANKN